MVTDAILYENLSQIPVNNISSQFHKHCASNIIINQCKKLWFRRNDTSPNYFSYFSDCIYCISISPYIQICNKNVIKGASLRSAASWMITQLHKGKYLLMFKFYFITDLTISNDNLIQHDLTKPFMKDNWKRCKIRKNIKMFFCKIFKTKSGSYLGFYI